jgi:hypothetical protein
MTRWNKTWTQSGEWRLRRVRAEIVGRSQVIRKKRLLARHKANERAAMERVSGWCGAEDGVGESYYWAWRYRYANQRWRRNAWRRKAAKRQEWDALLRPTWAKDVAHLERLLDSLVEGVR